MGLSTSVFQLPKRWCSSQMKWWSDWVVRSISISLWFHLFRFGCLNWVVYILMSLRNRKWITIVKNKHWSSSLIHSLFPSFSLFHFASSIVKQWIFSIFHSVIFFRYLVLYIPFYINHTVNCFEIINNYTWITFLKKRKKSKQPKREKRNSKKRHQFLQFQSNVCFISND